MMIFIGRFTSSVLSQVKPEYMVSGYTISQKVSPDAYD